MHLNGGADYVMAELICLFEVWMHNNNSSEATEGNKGNEDALLAAHNAGHKVCGQLLVVHCESARLRILAPSTYGRSER